MNTTFLHLRARLRECWILAENLRFSAAQPNWTSEPVIHSIVIERVQVDKQYRNQGEFRAFLDHICADERFEMVVVEAVQNPILAEAMLRWGWECDPGVMDFYKRKSWRAE